MFHFLHGTLAMSGIVAALFFWHAWRSTRDRLFVFFSGAFWILTVHWTIIGVAPQPVEDVHYIYALRLAAFALIIAGIVDKNRER